MADVDQPSAPVPEGQLRVGDRERHAAATALGDHFAAGRLDQQEFDDRVQAAYAARTRVELRSLFDDLPEPAPFRTPPPVPATPVRASTYAQGADRPWRVPVFVPILPLLLVALIVASVLLRFPVFPLFFIWFWLGAGRWRGPRRYAGPRHW